MLILISRCSISLSKVLKLLVVLRLDDERNSRIVRMYRGGDDSTNFAEKAFQLNFSGLIQTFVNSFIVDNWNRY
ncbi:MAG: hypothetical protein A2Y80_01060 [Deltaproteobacteria bacterium RBG_13_58_19]|nr:MAG: hypothetical protein A2Y80_01060 [Deltaproteobacteria bacterium RBG_13_58_19]